MKTLKTFLSGILCSLHLAGKFNFVVLKEGENFENFIVSGSLFCGSVGINISISYPGKGTGFNFVVLVEGENF